MMIEETELKKKVSEMYPEIGQHRLEVDVTFDAGRDAYLVEFHRGNDRLATRIETKDAEDCMQGSRCIYLGVQIAQFIRNFEERVVFGKQAA